MSVQVSVVVPTFNRPDLLRKCLDALLHQDFDPRAYEVVVVDNAGSDETRQLVESFAAEPQQAGAGLWAGVRPAVHYLREIERPGPAAARNFGWRFAHGDIVAFTDDDCLPAPDWLREGVGLLREGYDVLTGRVVVPISGPPTDYEKNISRLETAEFLTANCFIRCAALQATGGFDERFSAAWREDSDLHFRLISLSLKLGRASRARVVHPVRPAPWYISLKEQRKSMFNALLFKKHPALYRQRIQGSPPLLYYAADLTAIGVIVSLLAGWPSVAVALALGWLALTALFAARRLRGTRHTLEHIAAMVVTSALIPPLSIYWRLYGASKYRVWFL